MKLVLCILLSAWAAFVAELAFPGGCPRGSLLVPLAGGIVLWRRGLQGLAIAGLVLLVDLIVRPVSLPLVAMSFPLLAAALLMPPIGRCRESRMQFPVPLRLPIVTLVLLVLQAASDIELRWPLQFNGVDGVALRQTLVVAIPFSAGLTLLTRLADELGLRRPAISAYP